MSTAALPTAHQLLELGQDGACIAALFPCLRMLWLYISGPSLHHTIRIGQFSDFEIAPIYMFPRSLNGFYFILGYGPDLWIWSR